ILVWAGASTVGQYTVQLAALSGLHVLATASPRHHALLTALGAATMFDSYDPAAAAAIRARNENHLVHAVDCVTRAETVRQVAASLGAGESALALVFDETVHVPGVRAWFSIVYVLLGKVRR
ncbi:hypothetical protein DFH09DRAFT_884091, partial [Mycena vulgaris]